MYACRNIGIKRKGVIQAGPNQSVHTKTQARPCKVRTLVQAPKQAL